MKKIALIGDSIRMNYLDRTIELLKGEAVVVSPEENCRFSAYTLFTLDTYLPDDDYDVIHWNNGQWDVCYMMDGAIHTPLDTYLDYQKRIAGIVLEKAGKAVFATTTPVHDDQFEETARHGRKNADIIEYNEKVCEVLTAMGVQINDIHAAVSRDIQRYICADRVHLSEDGIILCADLVYQSVQQ